MLFAVSNGVLFKNLTVQTVLPFPTRAEQCSFKNDKESFISLYGVVSDIYMATWMLRT